MKLNIQITLALLIGVLAAATLPARAQKINRKSLVQRHNVVVNKADPLSSLTLGNGKFAFTIDVTGLQSFPLNYQKGVPLGTQSEWGWHSFIDTSGYRREEAIKPYQLNGREITYTVQWNNPERTKAAANWFRQNPHRLQLGNLGFELQKKDGTPAALSDVQNINQVLDLWTGEIKTYFTIENIPVQVSTLCHSEEDVIAAKVQSQLIKEGRLKVRLVFPYPTGEWTDEGTNYSQPQRHRSTVLNQNERGAVLSHQLDSSEYFVGFRWSRQGSVTQKQPHNFLITPSKEEDHFEFSARFTGQNNHKSLPDYTQTKSSSTAAWRSYWNSGGAIDFSGSSDKRAFELERRIILSQYLIKAQEASSFPPQETGLTYNSWFGKPHLEMHWWHAAHFALWGRTHLLERSLNWYADVADGAQKIAKRQGFAGIRWQKMTDNRGDEAPSSVGAFLIWQQPHFIYFAELVFRDKKNKAVLNQYKDLVFATADFMASYPYFDKEKDRYILGKGVIPAQERFKAEETYNPSFELVYWHWGLSMAQQWRERLGLPRDKKWDEVLQKLSPLPVQNNRYLFTESASDSYTNPEYKTDHPAVLGALGMMPHTGQVNPEVMKATFDWIWNNWSWHDTWGWDFPLTAMTATRLGMPEIAIDALLMDIKTNTYLPNGHNYQDDRLRIYLPGNGGLLAAAALLCAGYDGSATNPGIPKTGWKVKWEGLKKMP